MLVVLVVVVVMSRLKIITSLAEMLPVKIYCIFKVFWLSPSSRKLYMDTAFIAIIVLVIMRFHKLNLGVLTKCIWDVSIMNGFKIYSKSCNKLCTKHLS